MKRLLATLCVLMLAGGVTADEKTDRDRKARVALALAGGKPATATAPAPRAKAADYPEGYRKATADVQPLVVFVGLPARPVVGAVVAQADTFAGVTAPAVVIGYPVADRLMISVTLQGAPTGEQVQLAADTAAKKIDAPPAKDLPAPRPLSWNL